MHSDLYCTCETRVTYGKWYQSSCDRFLLVQNIWSVKVKQLVCGWSVFPLADLGGVFLLLCRLSRAARSTSVSYILVHTKQPCQYCCCWIHLLYSKYPRNAAATVTPSWSLTALPRPRIYVRGPLCAWRGRKGQTREEGREKRENIGGEHWGKGQRLGEGNGKGGGREPSSASFSS